ncbi:MAG: IS200/IS605 family transposase [Okeania sp. SIO3B5]|uniref:IS200/IS605 family transposase n=1 Tax=Okeania sp. SIO3B5 TaxID=2607811 RepID=UPI0013FFC4E6|nr:IS200/IS605 family transposase [Okeania sp. SIO3B5]NEO55894.1 IS200/IS605 family transposase [Okeania sp. SIO3B5]
MSNNYHKSFRSVYSLTVHIVLVTKYRQKVINSQILERLNQIFSETCQKWECELVEFSAEVDHVHLLINFNPKVQLSKFIANLKTVSSRLIRRDFADYLARFYRLPVLWTGSYFVASCGGVTIEQLKKYVEHQTTPTSIN